MRPRSPASAAWYLQIDSFSDGQVLEHNCEDRSAEGRRSALTRAPSRRDAEAAHLLVEIAALEAERVGRARDVAVEGGERAEDVAALPGVARLEQRLTDAVSARGGDRRSRDVEERQVVGAR